MNLSCSGFFSSSFFSAAAISWGLSSFPSASGTSCVFADSSFSDCLLFNWLSSSVCKLSSFFSMFSVLFFADRFCCSVRISLSAAVRSMLPYCVLAGASSSSAAVTSICFGNRKANNPFFFTSRTFMITRLLPSSFFAASVASASVFPVNFLIIILISIPQTVPFYFSHYPWLLWRFTVPVLRL